jgi:sulfur transfer protein SufE
VKVNQKILEYKKKIDYLAEIDTLLLYQWLIELGKKLILHPLSKDRYTKENKVSYCQYQLYVDWEDNQFKAWSDGMIASGYAYVLTDIFNSVPPKTAKKITKDDFKPLQIENLLTMNRTNGFFQMIEMMQAKIKTKAINEAG